MTRKPSPTAEGPEEGPEDGPEEGHVEGPPLPASIELPAEAPADLAERQGGLAWVFVALACGWLLAPLACVRGFAEPFSADPRVGAPPDSGARTGRGGQWGRSLPIELTSASARELRRLPGVGDGRARSIVGAREEHDDPGPLALIDVRGIGPLTVARVRAALGRGAGDPLWIAAPRQGPWPEPVRTTSRSG